MSVAKWIMRSMTMMMVLVMRMPVHMDERHVNMKVHMRFGQKKPDTNCHSD